MNPFSENFFGYKLIELLKQALEFLFVPQQSSIENLVNQVKSKFSFIDSVKIAKDFTYEAISHPIDVGSKWGPINHLAAQNNENE